MGGDQFAPHIVHRRLPLRPPVAGPDVRVRLPSPLREPRRDAAVIQDLPGERLDFHDDRVQPGRAAAVQNSRHCLAAGEAVQVGRSVDPEDAPLQAGLPGQCLGHPLGVHDLGVGRRPKAEDESQQREKALHYYQVVEPHGDIIQDTVVAVQHPVTGTRGVGGLPTDRGATA